LTDEEVVRTYRRTIRPLYAYVSRRAAGDRALAEDLVQETWMRALDAWPRRGVPDEPLAWLIRVARNTLIDHFRKAPPPSIDAASVDLEAPGFPPGQDDTASVIGWGLARLRRRHAELLEAFYFEGKSVGDIARERSLSERAVEGRLRRARAKLKKTLQRIVRPGGAPRASLAGGRTEHAKHT
jgi:RNA polymerase sigma-70 factor (ECF subfamily)